MCFQRLIPSTLSDCNLTLVRVLKVVSQDKVTDLLLFYYVCILFLFEAN